MLYNKKEKTTSFGGGILFPSMHTSFIFAKPNPTSDSNLEPEAEVVPTIPK